MTKRRILFWIETVVVFVGSMLLGFLTAIPHFPVFLFVVIFPAFLFGVGVLHALLEKKLDVDMPWGFGGTMYLLGVMLFGTTVVLLNPIVLLLSLVAFGLSSLAEDATLR